MEVLKCNDAGPKTQPLFRVTLDNGKQWDALENNSALILYGGGAIFAIWLSSVIVDSINSVPLLPKIMELVGLGYTGWFVYRYLLFKCLLYDRLKIETVIEHKRIKHDKNERSEEVETMEDLFKSLASEESKNREILKNLIEHKRIKHDKNERSEEVVTLEDLFKSLTSEDSKVVKDIILAAKGKQIAQDRKLREKKIDTNEAFEEFMKRFDSIPNHHRPDFKLYHCRFSSEMVKTGNYLIPKKLAPVFQDLLDKYGDFSAESTMSLKVKNCIYIALCDVAYHMCNTRLEDLHGHEFFNWQDWLLYAQNAGFKVQFAIDYFKKIVGAYYSLLLLVAELDQKIERLHVRIESLVVKRAQLLTSPVMSLEESNVSQPHTDSFSSTEPTITSDSLPTATHS